MSLFCPWYTRSQAPLKMVDETPDWCKSKVCILQTILFNEMLFLVWKFIYFFFHLFLEIVHDVWLGNCLYYAEGKNSLFALFVLLTKGLQLVQGLAVPKVLIKTGAFYTFLKLYFVYFLRLPSRHKRLHWKSSQGILYYQRNCLSLQKRWLLFLFFSVILCCCS